MDNALYEGDVKAVRLSDISDVVFEVTDLAVGMLEMCDQALVKCCAEDAGRYRLMMLGLHDISEKVSTLLPGIREMSNG